MMMGWAGHSHNSDGDEGEGDWYDDDDGDYEDGGL